MTTFAYFKENERNLISKEGLLKALGLQINCGNFSYVEAPKKKYYDYILGVTGTL